MSSNINFISLKREASKRHYDNGHGDNKEGVMSFGQQGFHGRVVECCGWDLREREREVVWAKYIYVCYIFFPSLAINGRNTNPNPLEGKILVRLLNYKLPGYLYHNEFFIWVKSI